jgi:K(+)-stimulated pyrophosphate-energized sodium pump
VIALVSVLIGIVLAVAIQQLTGYFTDTGVPPVKDVGKTSLTGPATVILPASRSAWSRRSTRRC